MERRANYAIVGVVTFGLAVALVAFIVWLAGFSFNREYKRYDVSFTGPVNGLSEGGEVRFNGIKVGEITRIALDPADASRVIARIRVDAGVPVRDDSVASSEPQGITGSSFIQITAGTPSRPLLMAVTPFGRIPVIQARRGGLAAMLEGGGTVVQRAVDTLDRMNRLLSDRNLQQLSGTIDSLRDVTDELARRRGAFGDAQGLIQHADEAARSLTQLAQSSNSLVNGDVRRAAGNLADASQNLKQTTARAQQVMARLDRSTADLNATGLPQQLSGAIVSLQQSAQSVDSLARELQQSPRGAFARSPPRERELKP